MTFSGEGSHCVVVEGEEGDRRVAVDFFRELRLREVAVEGRVVRVVSEDFSNVVAAYGGSDGEEGENEGEEWCRHCETVEKDEVIKNENNNEVKSRAWLCIILTSINDFSINGLDWGHVFCRTITVRKRSHSIYCLFD